MYKPVTAVQPLPDYLLKLTFDHTETRIFDMKPFLQLSVFAELQDESNFQKVHVCFDTIEWDNSADIDPETLYEKSIPA